MRLMGASQSTFSRPLRPAFANKAAEARVAAALAPVQAGFSSQAAEAYTRELTASHYENFSVVSWMLPKELRQDFCNVYAFCRIADDMADELGDSQRAVEALAALRGHTRDCYAGKVTTQLFAALGSTIGRHQIPIEPFLDLIDAFEQDQRVDRYRTLAEVVDYCRRSADPVGRLVLYMCGYRDEVRQRLSDLTCTALQLTNFWQDVRRDLLDRNRVYVPRETMDQFGVSEEQIREGQFDDRFAEMMRTLVDQTQQMFEEGEALSPMLHAQVRQHIALFGKGGEAILDAIRRQGYNTLNRRPTLSKWQKARLALFALGAGLAGSLGGGAAA